jgi:hypothetical protein
MQKYFILLTVKDTLITFFGTIEICDELLVNELDALNPSPQLSLISIAQ